jgi:alpha-tubulin suppressor-like RCC1 family protein
VYSIRRTFFWAPTLLTAFLLLGLGLASGAVASGASVKGWGYNQYGAVGVGSLIETVDTPAFLPGLSGVAQVAGGREVHALAVLADGSVRSWGNNEYGQLGDGTTHERTIAGPGPNLSGVVEVAAGEYHSVALLSSGRVMVWGDNEAGQLGQGSNVGPQSCGSGACATVPVEVPGITDAVAVGATEYSTFAVLSNGTVLGWGADRYGELGDGIGVQTGCHCVPTPVAIPGVSGAIAIDGSEDSVMALLADGRVMDWGWNDSGQAGNGTQGPFGGCECSPPVFAGGITTATEVAAGEYSGFALLADGTVMGWGANDDAELATGSTKGPEGCATNGGPEFACSKTPIPVGGLSGVREVAAMALTGVAVMNDGTLRSWGYNGSGTLGNGTHGGAMATVPAPVSNVSEVSSIGVGEEMGYALIGPSQTLSIAFAGAGSGSVTGRDVSCPPRCSASYSQGRVAMLSASRTDFAGFSGPCSGTGTCAAKMDSDQTVTATFGVPIGTKITVARIVSKKRKATFSFSTPGAITGYECLLVKPKPKKKRKAKASRSKFTSCNGPKAYKHLKAGKYTFKVRALDILGTDPKPAKRVFKIKPAKKKRRR